MADDEPGTLNRWTALYKDVLKPEAERCGREVGDVRGDRTLLEFEQVADAQEWSRLAHRAAAATGIGGTALRVAIHQGTVFSTREGLFGDAVNIAALFFARALEACPNHAFSWMLSSTTLSFMGRAEEARARAVASGSEPLPLPRPSRDRARPLGSSLPRREPRLHR